MNLFAGSSIFGKGSEYSQQAIKETQQKLKKIKYPVKAISVAIILKKKLNQLSADVRSKLEKKMDSNINAYRQVRGDGNCFFRALAFSYITNKNASYWEDIFTHINEISLESCKKETIPKQFRPYYKDGLLKEVLKAYWKRQYQFFVKLTIQQLGYRNYKRALARMLTQNPYLDFIIILYFRAVCLQAFKKNKKMVQDFLKGTEQDEIASYGEQSQGVIINLMSKVFKINVIIYQIRKNEVVSYEYNDKQVTYFSKFSQSNIYLLFYDNHYDILQNNPNPLAEFGDQKEEEQFYQNSNAQFIPGTCILCNLNTQINQENGLCADCIASSMQGLDTFKKDRFVEGFCTQCNRKRAKVSEQLQICQSCLRDLQWSGEDNAANPHVCKKCKLTKTPSQLHQDGNCYTCMFPDDPVKQKQSKLKSSKYDSQLSYSQFPNLIGKLQSQISKQQKKQIEEEIQLRNDVQGIEAIAQVNGLFRAKFFQRSKPIIYQCVKCKANFQSSLQLEGSDILCDYHRAGNSSKIVQQSSVKQSAFKGQPQKPEPSVKSSQSELKSSMKPEQSGIKQPYQSQIKNPVKSMIKHQNISAIKQQSVESTVKESKIIKQVKQVKQPVEYSFKCKTCKNNFTTFVDGLKQQEKICVECLKKMKIKKVTTSQFKKPQEAPQSVPNKTSASTFHNPSRRF